jgi:hypothetical protein
MIRVAQLYWRPLIISVGLFVASNATAFDRKKPDLPTLQNFKKIQPQPHLKGMGSLRRMRGEKSEFQVINEESIKIDFQIRTRGEPWTEFTLPAKSNELIGCDCDLATIFEIQVTTENDKQVNYSLSSGARYGIYWNANEKKWDVRQLIN